MLSLSALAVKIRYLRPASLSAVTTCKFFSEELGFGNLRIDGWSTRDTRAPHVAVHLCIVFNVLFIYIGCPPRTNLVLDDAYNDHVYGDARPCLGKSLNDLHVECVEDRRFKQYVSKSHVVNAFMVAPTTLLYTVPFSKKNFARVRELSMQYMRAWLEMLDETEGVLVDGIDSREVQTELLQLDVRTRQFCGRDPDTKVEPAGPALECSPVQLRFAPRLLLVAWWLCAERGEYLWPRDDRQARPHVVG